MTSPPNILWYCTDQQRFDTIAALGNPHVVTPTMDSLVAEGTALTCCYCQSPICTPSRASFLTGLYPSRARNCRNGNENYPGHPRLVSKRLADAGYDCGLIGKFHLQSAGHRTEPRLEEDGYRYWRFSHAPRDDWPQGHDYAEWVRGQGEDLDELRHRDERVPPGLHQTAWATDRAIEFVTQDRSGPWMLSVNVYDPHPPFIPPRSYADRFDRDRMPGPYFRDSDLASQARLAEIDFQTLSAHPDTFDGQRVQALYYAMIAQVDDQLGRLLDCLDATGQRDDTLVIFTSDHGESLGDHGLLYKGCRFYEGLVRVPLIFRWPGHVQAGVKSDALVELLDKSATIVDVAGAGGLDELQGRSLWPLLSGRVSPDHHRDFVRSEYYDALDPAFIGTGSPDTPKPTDAATDGSDDEPTAGTYGTMYRDRRHKLSVYHGHEIGELFDLETDPWEFDNLWEDPAAAGIKAKLIKASFDASIQSGVDVGTRRIAPM